MKVKCKTCGGSGSCFGWCEDCGGTGEIEGEVTMQDKVNALMQHQLQAALLHEEIGHHVEATAKRVAEAAKELGDWGGQRYAVFPCYSWEIDVDDNGQGYVAAKWEDHWRYGGYDSGTFTFPVELLWDETKMVEFEAECKTKLEAIAAAKLVKQKKDLEAARDHIRKQLVELFGEKNEENK